MAYGLTANSNHTTFNKILMAIAKQVAVSGYDVDTQATLAKAFLFNSSHPDFQPGKVITDVGRATGQLEPTTMKTAGRRVAWALQHDDPPSSLLAIIAAFGMAGTCTKTTTAAGVFKYSIGLRTNTARVPPWLTLGWRAGKTITRQVHYGASVNQFTISQAAAAGEYLKLTAALLGTGRRVLEPKYEVVSEAGNETSLTITGPISGSSAGARVANIHKILYCESPARAGQYTDGDMYSEEVQFTGSADSTHVTIVAPTASSDPGNYLIIFVSTAVESDNLALIDSLTPSEKDAFDISHLSDFKIGGTWNGSAYADGWNFRDADADGLCHFDGFSWTFNSNNQERTCAGGSADYVDMQTLGTPSQSVALGRYMTDWVLQHFTENVVLTSLYAKWTGSLIDTTNRHYLELVFPRLKGSKADIDPSGDQNKESLTLTPLAGGTYPTVVLNIQTDLDGIMGL